ncbi:glycosyltransferase [Cognatitamlana onchidii]|uniref:glycosyltransferase n=1 Tax=Cognatitamlana onchidii TaxID=2562860 RepID=UPI0010A5D1A0|nr:glycosyltransferase [Algibacter onchidii]
MKLAILTPLPYKNSETFIKNHIDNLPFEKVVVHGKGVPSVCEGKPLSKSKQLLIKLKVKLFKQKFSSKELFLISILKREKVDLVFAEFLNKGASVVNVCRHLNIPLATIGLGYEISKYQVLKENDKNYKQLVQFASKLFIVSRHMKINLMKFNCSQDKIIYSPAGPVNTFFNIEPNFSKPQLLAIGRFVDKKAPHLTILAFKKVLEKFPTATLKFAGDGVLLNASKDLAKHLSIDKNVVFLGRISTEEHIKLLESSYMFIQHSKIADDGDSEGTPVAILEASAAGLPIVSTKHAGIPDVILDGKTGCLVDENDVDAMADRILFLLLNKEEAINFGKAGKKFVKSNFSEDKHIDILTEHLRKCTF